MLRSPHRVSLIGPLLITASNGRPINRQAGQPPESKVVEACCCWSNRHPPLAKLLLHKAQEHERWRHQQMGPSLDRRPHGRRRRPMEQIEVEMR